MTAPLSYTYKTAAEATGLTVATLSRAVKSGHLRAKRSGVTEDGEPTGSYVILAADLQAWLESLAAA